MSRKPGRGDLPPKDRALWNRVARSVDPLPGRHILADPPQRTPPIDQPTRIIAPPPQPPVSAPSATAPKADNRLDGSWDRKLARGRLDPDATIDLHGLTLDQAWRRLDFALEEAIAIETRVLLVITGKAARDPSAGRAMPGTTRPRGMIRAKLDDWLAASRHASHISAIRSAHPRHGGAGAVYLILRRRRG